MAMAEAIIKIFGAGIREAKDTKRQIYLALKKHPGGGTGVRSEEEVNRAVDQYADTIKRVCFCYMKNREDTEDIFQTVFLKYMLSNQRFDSADHEKAWLLRVAINACKDQLKSFFRRHMVSLEEIAEMEAEGFQEQGEVLKAVLSLPEKYKDVIYLYYFEGYTAAEIGKILKKRENTIYSLLSRGRGLLKEKLGGDGIEE